MFDCREPERRKRPEWCGAVDTTPVGEIWDIQHPDCPLPPLPDCGYVLKPMPPVCGMNEQEQLSRLNCKMDEVIHLVNDYSKDVYGAYTAIVNSALCNDAYYNEITVEEGYIAEASAPYKVVHIPFLDRAKQPIYFELGLAYNNTTNANVHEDVFNASQRVIADKLIPAYNSTNTWVGAVVWNGAPIGNIGENPATYTFGVTKNGFFKLYENLTNYNQLKQDNIRNAFMANSILVQGGKMTPDKFYPDEKAQLIGRVGVGMNYDTKERFIVIVQGSEDAGCTAEQLANIFLKYNCTVAAELANMNMTTALDKGAFMFTPPTTAGAEVPTIPEVNAFWYITKRRHYHNEYVKDVAGLTQKYGEMLWRTETANISVDNVKEVVAGFQNALDKEVSDREEGDKQLQENIDAEATARENGDTTLQNNINKLSSHVDDVETELKQADTTLQNNIDQLRTDLTAKDIMKVVKTSDNSKNIYRIQLNDSTFVDVAIETYDYSLLTQKLDTLSALEPRLEAEVTARQTADARIEGKADQNTADIAELKTTKVSKAGDTMSGNLDMQQNTVTNVKDPVSDTDVVTLGYFNANKGDTSGQYLPTAGGTMGGNIDMSGNKIVNVPNPSGDTDASNKQYVDNQITTQVPTIVTNQIEEKVPQMVADEINDPDSPVVTELDKKFLPLTGGALTGALSLGGNAVTNVADPSNATDGVNKQYVDNALSGVTGKALRGVTENEFNALTFTQIQEDSQKYAGYIITESNHEDTGRNLKGTVYVLYGVQNFSPYHVYLMEYQNSINSYASGLKVFDYKFNSTTGILEDSLFSTYVFMERISSGEWSADSNRITEVADPTSNQDATNKQYVDNKVADYLPLTGGTLKGALILSGDPTQNTQAATKGYVDSKIASAGGGDFMASGAVPMSGDLNMDNHKIVAVSDPTESTDGANKHYVDSTTQTAIADAQFLPLAGGTVTGATTFSGAVTVIAPTGDMNPTTKAYTDAKIQELQTALDTANGIISTLQSELTTAKSNISTLQNQVSTLNTFMNKFQPMLNTIYNG